MSSRALWLDEGGSHERGLSIHYELKELYSLSILENTVSCNSRYSLHLFRRFTRSSIPHALHNKVAVPFRWLMVTSLQQPCVVNCKADTFRDSSARISQDSNDDVLRRSEQ